MRTHKDARAGGGRYGLGTAIAFTSDAQPRWAQRWLGWDGYAVFWTQVIRSAMRPSAQPNLGLTATVRNGQAIVELQAFTPQGEPINGLTPKLTVGMPSGETTELTLSMRRGTLHGAVPAARAGAVCTKHAGRLRHGAHDNADHRAGSALPAGVPLLPPEPPAAGADGVADGRSRRARACPRLRPAARAPNGSRAICGRWRCCLR